MEHIASCSFGKDSLAMVLLLIDKGYPLDEVVFFNTGWEYEAIERLRDALLPLLAKHGIKYTELHPEKSFDYLMFEKPVCKRGTKIVHKHGYGWCGGPCRWGTTEKYKALDKHTKGAHVYIGLAADEPERVAKLPSWKSAPLAEWRMTEREALEYCYSQGFHWDENGVDLYDVLDRVSCWCCRNKNQEELANMKQHLPQYFNRLLELEHRIGDPMKKHKGGEAAGWTRIKNGGMI